MIDVIICGKTIIENPKEQARNSSTQQKQELPYAESRERKAVQLLYDVRIRRSGVYGVPIEEVNSLHFSLESSDFNKHEWKIHDRQGNEWDVIYLKIGNSALAAYQQEQNFDTTHQNTRYNRLLELASSTCNKLNGTVEFYNLLRQMPKLAAWTESEMRHIQIEYVGENLEQAEVMLKEFNDRKFEMSLNGCRLAKMNDIGIQLLSSGQTEASSIIQTQMIYLNNKWIFLENCRFDRARQLRSAFEIDRFHRDADETIDWIQREEAVLNEEDPLTRPAQRSIHVLLKVERIDKIANQLVQTHPESAETILAKQEKINKLWTQLTEAKRRKETSKLQKFLHGHNNLMAFMSWTMDLVSLTTEAKSATAFEVLNKEHQKNRKESDGHAERFKALVEFGNQLFYSSHYASREIREMLEQLEQKRKDMDQLIECQNKLDEDLTCTVGLIIFCLDRSNWK